MPKTCKNLHLQIYTFESLYRAHRQATSGLAVERRPGEGAGGRLEAGRAIWN